MFTKEQKAYIAKAIAAAVASVLIVIGAVQLQVNNVQDRVDILEGSPTSTPAPTTPPPTTVPPTTPPTPTPTPSPSGSPSASPSVTPTPTPTPAPGLPGPEPTGPGGGVFSVTCNLNQQAPIDPIVYPGQVGVVHVHDFFGAKPITPTTTTAQLQGMETTCLHTDDHAAYWAPSLFSSTGVIAKPKSIFAYYQASSGDPVRAFPAGLVMIADGFNDPSGKSGFSCSDQGPFMPGPVNCPQKLVMHVHFPNCWSGKSLDSPDHRSHMSYSIGGKCDAAHPILLVQMRVHVQYSGLTNGTQYHIGPNPDGSFPKVHADFMNGWLPGALERIIANCINAGKECKQDIHI